MKYRKLFFFALTFYRIYRGLTVTAKVMRITYETNTLPAVNRVSAVLKFSKLCQCAYIRL